MRRRGVLVGAVVVAVVAIGVVAFALRPGPREQGAAAPGPTRTTSTPAGTPTPTLSPGGVSSGSPSPGSSGAVTGWPQLPPVTGNPPPGLSAPSKPAGISITEAGEGSWRIDWVDSSSNEAEFVVGDHEATRRVPANTTSYVWSGRTIWQGPCFWVSAYNAAGYSPQVGTCLAWVAPPGNPAIPPSMPRYASANPLNATTVRVSWEDTYDGEAGFRLRTSRAGQMTTEDKPAKEGAHTTVVYDIAVEPGVQYCFEVLTFTATQVSGWTAPVCATTTPPPTPGPTPAAPTGLTAVAGSQPGTVVLTWTDNSENETSFTVNLLGNASPFDKVLPRNQTSYTFPGLPGGVEACFRVYAAISGGGTAASSDACATPAG